MELGSGSYGKLSLGLTAATNLEKSSHLVNFEYNGSKGYRENTDYNNINYFLKSSIQTNHQPIDVIATFIDRKFGASNFYTNNPVYNEYEELKQVWLEFQLLSTKTIGPLNQNYIGKEDKICLF